MPDFIVYSKFKIRFVNVLFISGDSIYIFNKGVCLKHPEEVGV